MNQMYGFEGEVKSKYPFSVIVVKWDFAITATVIYCYSLDIARKGGKSSFWHVLASLSDWAAA